MENCLQEKKNLELRSGRNRVDCTPKPKPPYNDKVESTCTKELQNYDPSHNRDRDWWKSKNSLWKLKSEKQCGKKIRSGKQEKWCNNKCWKGIKYPNVKDKHEYATCKDQEKIAAHERHKEERSKWNYDETDFDALPHTGTFGRAERFKY